MRGRVTFSCVAVCLMLSLAACGNPLCGPSEPSSKGAVSSGPVPIATDRSVYAPSDPIHITVTNTLDKRIYLVSRLGQQCPIIVLAKEEDGRQITMNSCHPGGEAAPTMVEVSLAPKGYATFTLSAANLDQPLVAGIYQAATRYVTFHPLGQEMVHADNIAVWIGSASIRVCDCASC